MNRVSKTAVLLSDQDILTSGELVRAPLDGQRVPLSPVVLAQFFNKYDMQGKIAHIIDEYFSRRVNNERADFTVGERILIASFIDAVSEALPIYRSVDFAKAEDMRMAMITLGIPEEKIELINRFKQSKALSHLGGLPDEAVDEIRKLIHEVISGVVSLLTEGRHGGVPKIIHIDTTSRPICHNPRRMEAQPSIENSEFKIKKGWLKNRKPRYTTLKQVTANAGSEILHVAPVQSNKADVDCFQEIFKMSDHFFDKSGERPIFAMDAAGCSTDLLLKAQEKEMRMVTRLTNSFSISAKLVEKAKENPDMWESVGQLAKRSEGANYQIQDLGLHDISKEKEGEPLHLRVIAVRSSANTEGRERAQRKLIEKESKKLKEIHRKYCRTKYMCMDDAKHQLAQMKKEVERTTRGIHPIQVTIQEEEGKRKRPGRPRKNEDSPKTYRIQMVIGDPELARCKEELDRESIYLLVTTISSEDQSAFQILCAYKGLWNVERTNRLIKDPRDAGNIFVKSAKGVRGLCIMKEISAKIRRSLELVVRYGLEKTNQEITAHSNTRQKDPTVKTILNMLNKAYVVCRDLVSRNLVVQRAFIPMKQHADITTVLTVLGLTEDGLYISKSRKGDLGRRVPY